MKLFADKMSTFEKLVVTSFFIPTFLSVAFLMTHGLVEFFETNDLYASLLITIPVFVATVLLRHVCKPYFPWMNEPCSS